MTKLPDNMGLMELYRAGMTDKQIAIQFDVTVAAVNKRFKALGIRRAPFKVIVANILEMAWPVNEYNRTAFSNLSRYKSLLAFMRRRMGDTTITPRQQYDATLFERKIREGNIVLHLDPLADHPWQFVPREPRDGNLVIRWPADSERPTGAYLAAVELPEQPWS